MSKRNATASWSGYSHQGQVGLLLAIRKAQSLINDNQESDLGSYFVEYENKEDVAIYFQELGKENKYISVHQVKAYYSDGNNLKSKYGKVLNDDFNICGNDYLHTVCKIEDWTTSGTSNSNAIKLFEYTQGVHHCDTTEIENLILEGIKTILNCTDTIAKLAYQKLSFRLDHIIRQEHKKGKKTLFDIKLSLGEIHTIINDNSDLNNEEIYHSRKQFYELYRDKIKSQDIENEHLNHVTENIIESIYNLENSSFLKFLQRLNFNESPENLDDVRYNFNASGLRQVFFKVLLEIVDSKPEINESMVKYLKGDSSEHFVLTSIIDEAENGRIIVENIIRNLDLHKILWDNHAIINKEISEYLYKLNPNIKSIPLADESHRDKFMAFSKKSRLISRDDAKSTLNDD